MREIRFKNLEKEYDLSLEKKNLFKKVEVIKNNLDESSSKKFSDLNLCIGEIIDVQKVHNSQKLYVLKINFGNQIRQIVSGLQSIYLEKELLNRKVIGIINLKEAKLANTLSQGMILAVDNPQNSEDCSLLTSNLKVGENLKCEEEVANSKKEINIKSFLKYNLYIKDKKAFFCDKVILNVFEEKGFDGKIR